jgi:NhaP-type Na+/H+ or K+/H+ antiporter
VSWGDLAVVAAIILLWAAVSGRAERFGITAPMVFVVIGLALGGEQALHITLSTSTIRVSAELTLVMVLFADAARIRISSIRQDIGIPLRLLSIGLVLTVVLGALFAHLLFGSNGIWMAILIAVCLAPTDAGLGAGIVTNPSVPSRVRRALNVESGLNDGIAAPLVSLAVAVLAGQSGDTSASLLHALREIGLGALVGVGGGLIVGLILTVAVRRGWTEQGAVGLATIAAAIGAYALAVSIHGNGFVAAFLAGLCFGIFRHRIGSRALELTEGSGQLLACLVWFAFGAAMLRPAISSPVALRSLAYGIISLTVIRMVPVALAMIGTRLGVATIAFMGWFGPRGLASVIFALLASDDLGQKASTVVTVVSITVALSVLVHGLSANVLINRYGKLVKSHGADHPVGVEMQVPASRRTFGAVGPINGRERSP